MTWKIRKGKIYKEVTAEAKLMNQLRHALADENQEEGLESVLKRLGETSSNVEFLALAQRGRA